MNSYKEKKLFTPGPLCASREVKESMLCDLGSRDLDFIGCVKDIRKDLIQIANVDSDEYVAILLQGSGTFCVEALFWTSSSPDDHNILILSNGAYGVRMATICKTAGLKHTSLHFSETDRITSNKEIEAILRSEEKFSLVAMVHCETSTGVINNVEEVGKLIKKYQKDCLFFVDAMSSFGAVPLSINEGHIDFVVSSANKCLEGVPGFAFAICNKGALMKCKGNSRSLVLDLHHQYEYMESNGQFRFTPPTHSILAFRTALKFYMNEGGLEARNNKYKSRSQLIREAMINMGFKMFLGQEHESYIITSYLIPSNPKFSFTKLYSELSARDLVIYPGSVTSVASFRIGNIGHISINDCNNLILAIRDILVNMGIELPLN